MEWQEMLDTLQRMPPDVRSQWLLVAGGLAGLLAALLWLEGRHFARSGRTGSWALVRLASLLAALLALALLFLPARAVSGMAALGVFYLALLTVVPLVWFGTHLWAGRQVRPGLSPAESLALACTGLVLAAILLGAFFAAQRPLQDAARDIGERRVVPAAQPALEHRLGPVVALQLPGVGLVYAQTLTGAPDTRLLRVEQRLGSQWSDRSHGAPPVYCTDGNDIHLLWLGLEAPPYLRIHWSQSNGAQVRAEFTPTLPAGPAAAAAVPFQIVLRPDGLDPAVPIPRARMFLVLHRPGQPPYTQMLGSPVEAGEVRTTDCVRQGFQVWPRRSDWALQSAVIQFPVPSGGPALRAVLERAPG